MLVTYFSILLKIQFKWLYIVIKTQGRHGIQDVFTVDRFPLFCMTPVTRFTGNEADKLRHAFLNTLSSVFGDLDGIKTQILVFSDQTRERY